MNLTQKSTEHVTVPRTVLYHVNATLQLWIIAILSHRMGQNAELIKENGFRTLAAFWDGTELIIWLHFYYLTF